MYDCKQLIIDYEVNSFIAPKVGLIVLDTDLTTERDFFLLRNRFNVDWNVYVSRVAFDNPITAESLADLVDKLPDAAEAILPGVDLDAIVFNCTAASAFISDEKVAKAVGMPNVITTASAVVEQIKKSKVNSIDVLFPYEKSVSIALADHLESRGININSLHYLNIEDDREIANVSHGDIIKLAKKASNDSEGLFFSCTALRAAEIASTLEQETGKKIFTSNLASFNSVLSLLDPSH